MQGFGAPFRLAGLTFLQYVGVSSRALRHSLKEPLKSKALAREQLFFNRSTTGEKSELVKL